MAMPIGELQGRAHPLRHRSRGAAAVQWPVEDPLDRTHRHMLALLGDMARLLAHLAADTADSTEARRIARALCRGFGRETRDHHAEEERRVFPALVARGDAALTRHVLRLQQDHGWLEEDWFQIEPHLQAIAQGLAGADTDLLRETLPVFDSLLREHIALEESVVYPAARAAAAGH